MRSNQNTVAITINARPLSLRMGTPQHKYQRRLTHVQLSNHRICELLPTLTLMGPCETSLNRQHAIEQQHTSLGPHRQITMGWLDQPLILMQLPENIP